MVQANELINILMSQLGVTQKQASGGAGAIFRSAKQNMGAADFKKVESSVPGVDSIMEDAPKVAERPSVLQKVIRLWKPRV